jgi:hypothetical protein
MRLEPFPEILLDDLNQLVEVAETRGASIPRGL